jgi:hypothetical protein
MNRAGFLKSVRMFRKFSEETLRRRGGDQLGRDGVVALVALESVLKAERLLDGSLLEPLQAFTSLLQSAQLPPDFGDYGFGDALLAIEDAHAELRQSAEQRWEFAPELPAEKLALLTDFKGAAAQPSTDQEHLKQLRACVLDAASSAKPGAVVVVGALRCGDLPLSELATRFERVTLSDLDTSELEALVRRVIPETLRGRVRLERYDPTGSYVAFAEGVSSAVQAAADLPEAERALDALLQSYDVGAGSAGLTATEGNVDLAVSALLLSELGRGYASCIERSLIARGWTEPGSVAQAPLQPALSLLSRLVEQHHVHALLRRASSALLISAVSDLILTATGSGKGQPVGEPRDLLGVERLSERLPKMADVKQERSWEWRRPLPGSAEKGSLLTLVEAVLV